VYVPVLDRLYWGEKGKGAYLIETASKLDSDSLRNGGISISGSIIDNESIRIVASRSHLNDETQAYINILEDNFKQTELVSSGSSLKLCQVAEGTADVYPRFAPTMEWDTAAADAVCRAAGCYVVDTKTGNSLVYNKNDLHNPWFLVGKDKVFKEILSLGQDE
jgi:3'(2'), 5'-bisphosphate nucleotidase